MKSNDTLPIASRSPGPAGLKRVLGLLGASVGLALLAAGCASSAPVASAPTASSAPAPAPAAKEKPAAPAAAKPATLKKVVLADGALTPTRWPLWIAVEEGFFKKNGIDFELVQVESAPVGTQALVGRKADFTVTAAPDAMNPAAAGAPIKVVATLQAKADVNFAAKPGIDSAAKLKGAKVGVSRPGTISHLTAWLMIQSLGLDPDKDVSYVDIGNDMARAAALQAGSIDAAALNPTASGKLRREMGLKPLVEGASANFALPGSNLYTLAPIFQGDPEMVKGVIRGLRDGLDWVHDPANKKRAFAILEKYMKMKPDDPGLEEAYETYVTGKLFHRELRVPKEGFQKTKDFLKKFNEKIGQVDLDQILDTTLVDAIMAEKK